VQPWGDELGGSHFLRLVLCIAALAVAAPAAHTEVPKPPIEIAAPSAAQSVVAPSRPTLKRKVAVGRFSNSTRYGKALLIEAERDPLADQAADMLTARLIDSGQFLVFERGDLDVISREQTGAEAAKLVGVDALLVGSVTEFGRKIEGKAGFLNSKTRQVASATVEVRLVDVRTGQAFFSTAGSGSASVEVGEVAGFGSRAGYDSTLNDKAISAAISDLMTNVIQKLQERRWFTDVLQVRGDQLYLSGGPAQGLKIGEALAVEARGETVTSGQSGLPITLPGHTVARLEVISFFGDAPESEGTIARIVQGQVSSTDLKTLRVVEVH
jgi:curli biogenesis system outer membrane secretion channel CsgG